MSFVGLNEAVLIVAGLVALIWGPKKLPELARSLGSAKSEFKKGLDEDED
jgi:TatA/E family protein of Tat protein translocase